MKPILVLAAYCLGSLSFAVILVRLVARRDIREEGSGNAGATNVLRRYGAKAGIAVALLDVGKGALAVYLMGLVTSNPAWLGAAAVAVVAGHMYPLFFGFRGGKGVATTVGAFLVLAFWPTLCAVGVFVAVVATTRYVSLGSLAAAVALPPLAHVAFGVERRLVAAMAVAALLIVVRHSENLRRLAAGTERRIGRK